MILSLRTGPDLLENFDADIAKQLRDILESFCRILQNFNFERFHSELNLTRVANLNREKEYWISSFN